MCGAKDEIATLRSQQRIATLSSKARNDTLNLFVLSPFLAFIMKRDKPDNLKFSCKKQQEVRK